jgi:hypothetical protein
LTNENPTQYLRQSFKAHPPEAVYLPFLNIERAQNTTSL